MKQVKKETSVKYNAIIKKQVESKFDIVFPFAAVACFITSFIITRVQIPIVFSYVNLVMGTTLTVLFIYRKLLSVEIKISITIAFAMFMGFIAFLDGGYTSAFATLFALGNIISVLFMTKRFSHRLGHFSIIIYLVLWIYNEIFLIDTLFYLSPDRFFIQFMVFVLYLIMLNISVYSIKKSLNDSISKLEVTLDKVNHIAYYDQLTRLPNTSHFLMKLDNLKPTSGSIIIIHLRSLRVINSIYGENTGDEVLQYFAIEMKRIASKDNLVARHNGNEFIIFCTEPNEKRLRIRLNESLVNINESIRTFLKDITLDYYIGFSFIEKDEDYKVCYEHSKIALTFAKKYNIGNMFPFKQELLDEIRKEEDIKNSIEKAIENEEIKLVYQEKVNSKTNEVIGLEVLARWHHHKYGDISPEYFIPLIEKVGLSIMFGDYIVEHSLAQYQNIVNKYGGEISLSINISPSHLISPNFVTHINKMKNDLNIPSGKIILEITEEVMIEDFDIVEFKIEQLHDYGFKLSLDDFGSGFSSINYLASLDIDEVKLDKDFIKNICNNVKTLIIIESLVDIADKYKISIIAEGVETENQVKTLSKIGCINMQGYYFAKPKEL